MSTIELRRRLISQIEKTKDDGLLEEVYRLLGLELEEVENFKLSDEQNKAIDEAREQIKRGNTLTNEQADNEIDEWLSK